MNKNLKLEDWLPNQLSQDIWTKKYQFEGETLDDWFKRVSNGNEKLAEAIRQKKFIFGGRILANRGLHKLGKKITYSNCYVLAPPADNLESIFKCAAEMARTFSYGGGVGIDISKLAPKGAKINNAANETSGAVSFMDLFSMTTELIGQNGRRGAAMISISCDHPDLLDFIEVKNNPDKVTKANISIRVTDDFMIAAANNDPYELKFVRENTGEVISKMVNARDILHLIAKSNWQMAEPGMLYWDAIENWNLLSADRTFEFAGVNPCAEEPLPPYGSCLLGSINLSEFILNPFTETASFDFESFIETVKIGVQALNEVLHEGLPLHPLKEQQECVDALRQIGLGCFGWHDALIKLEIKYGNQMSLDLAKEIGEILINEALCESARMTDVYGVYPRFNLDAILRSAFVITNATEATKGMIARKGLANSQILTIPPTGSIATMLGVSTALEPMFSTSYTRKTESLHGETKYYKVFTPIVAEYMERFGIKDEADLPEFFNTTADIPYIDRIKMQNMWQRYIDASISATVNVPESFTIEEVQDLYIKAWEYNLKGITIFRDNCFRTGILTNNPAEENPVEEIIPDNSPKRGEVLKAPTECIGKTYKMVTGCGNAYLTVSWDMDGKLIQTFTNKGSSGTCRSNQEAVSRLISQSLRGGIPIEDIIDQLKSVDVCPAYATARARGKSVSPGSSCPYAMALVLEKAVKDGKMMVNSTIPELPEFIGKPTNEPQMIPPPANTMPCPECGEPMATEGGCVSCRNCSYSLCN